MGVSRRDFFKLSGSSLVLGALSSELSPAEAKERELRTMGAKETRTGCHYCSVGCGIIVHTKDGKVVYTEGDLDHPINEGTLCSKGASLFQIIHNPLRLTKTKYRGAGAEKW